MSLDLSKTACTLLEGPNVAVVATVMPDGSPQTTAGWVHTDAGRPIIATTKDTLKYRNIVRDPRVGITVFLSTDPYIEVNLRGRVTSIEDDSDHDTINMLSEKYYGLKQYPYLSAEQEWVKLVIEVDRVRSNKELPDA